MAPSQHPAGDKMTRRSAIATVGSVGALSLAGCFGSDDSGLSGEIQASGSNTVAPITQIAAEDFETEYGGVAVNVEPEGTGAGFQEFCRGNSAFQSASREITEEEIDLCGENDIEYTSYTVGQDTLAVGVNEDNDWCDQITLEELNMIWEFQSDVEQWSDVRDEWPDEDIALHGRDSASGTFDYFTGSINGEMGNIRDDYSATSQTDEIWNAVDDNEWALGWGGVGHLRSLQDAGGTLQTVDVESNHPDYEGEFFPPEEQYIAEGSTRRLPGRSFSTLITPPSRRNRTLSARLPASTSTTSISSPRRSLLPGARRAHRREPRPTRVGARRDRRRPR